MTRSTERRTNGDEAREEQLSLDVGRAAGYCWVQNPDAPGRCTWSPDHSGKHKDVYVGTEW